MASNYSFDVVSQIDMQEMDNAVNQARKEITQRYDFKGNVVEMSLSDDEVTLRAESEYKLQSIVEVLKAKMIKRGIAVRFLDEQNPEPAAGGTVKQILKIKKGISREISKKIVLDIKASKIKVQAQVMDDLVRITGKDKDHLQSTIQFLKQNDYGIELQFVNYRS